MFAQGPKQAIFNANVYQIIAHHKIVVVVVIMIMILTMIIINPALPQPKYNL